MGVARHGIDTRGGTLIGGSPQKHLRGSGCIVAYPAPSRSTVGSEEGEHRRRQLHGGPSRRPAWFAAHSCRDRRGQRRPEPCVRTGIPCLSVMEGCRLFLRAAASDPGPAVPDLCERRQIWSQCLRWWIVLLVVWGLSGLYAGRYLMRGWVPHDEGAFAQPGPRPGVCHLLEGASSVRQPTTLRRRPVSALPRRKPTALESATGLREGGTRR